jgi:hypothetical protein
LATNGLIRFIVSFDSILIKALTSCMLWRICCRNYKYLTNDNKTLAFQCRCLYLGTSNYINTVHLS